MSLYDRVRAVTGTIGTGPILMGGAVSGYRPFSVVTDGDTVSYVIEDGTAWEVGHGVWDAEASTLTRYLVTSSTGSLIGLSGNANAYITPHAADFFLSASPTLTGIVSIDGTLATTGGAAVGGSSSVTGEMKATYFLVPNGQSYAFGIGDGTTWLKGGGTPNPYLSFGTNNAEVMRLLGKNLGIGTASPVNPLVVANGSGRGIELVPGATCIIQSYDRATAVYLPMKLDFATLGLRAGGAEALSIDATGVVRIGDPAKGHVSVHPGTGSSAGYIGIYNGSAARLGYIGFGNSSLDYVAEGGYHAFSGGRVVLSEGQLKFPVTQNPSADANTLDDYEEGTFTPSLLIGGAAVGMTFTTQTGRYTKIGRQVHAHGQIALSAKGSLTGAVTITGLPFNNGGSFGAAVQLVAHSLASNIRVAGLLAGGATYIDLYQQTDVVDAISQAAIQNSTQFWFNVTYTV